MNKKKKIMVNMQQYFVFFKESAFFSVENIRLFE